MAKKKTESEENINDENQEFNDIDENFGLPDLEYQPADEVEEEEITNESSDSYTESEEENTYSYESESTETEAEVETVEETKMETESYTQEADNQDDTQNDGYVPGTYANKMNDESGGGKTTGIIVAVIVVLAIAAGGYWWFVMKPKADAAEKAKQEQIAKEEADKKKKEDYDKLIVKGDGEVGEESWDAASSSFRQAAALFPDEEYPNNQLTLIQGKIDSITTANEKPKVGEIESITERTNRYHIIVSSSIDGDLAMDYAKKISAAGDGVGIIAPYGQNKYYRLTLGSYDTWQDAENAVGSFSNTYGNGIWILKY